MEDTHKLLEDMAHQPVSYWGALLVIGSLGVGWYSVRRMIHTLKEQNAELRGILRERDQRIKELNDKLLALLEEKERRRRGGT
jgi:hypothetical protein